MSDCTPAHKQTSPDKAPGQVVYPLEVPMKRPGQIVNDVIVANATPIRPKQDVTLADYYARKMKTSMNFEQWWETVYTQKFHVEFLSSAQIAEDAWKAAQENM